MKTLKKLFIILLVALSTTLPAQTDIDRGLGAYYPFDSSGINKSPNRLPIIKDFVLHNVSYNYGFEGKTTGSIAPNFYGDKGVWLYKFFG